MPLTVDSLPRIHGMPFTRIELAVLSIVQGELAVLLGKRQEAPHKGKWALPGGVLRIDLDQDLNAAAQRVARERLGVELPFLRLLTTVGNRSRDPRAPWALAIVYRAQSCTARSFRLVRSIRWQENA